MCVCATGYGGRECSTDRKSFRPMGGAPCPLVTENQGATPVAAQPRGDWASQGARIHGWFEVNLDDSLFWIIIKE